MVVMNDEDFTDGNSTQALLVELAAELVLVLFAGTIAALILIWCI
jgi:hypothetical protein